IARERNMPPERFRELRNEVVACLALPDLRLVKQQNGWPNEGLPVDFDGTLERVVRVDPQGAVSVRRLADDVEIAQLPGWGFPVWARLSSDGQFLALFPEGRGRLTVWKLAGPRSILVLDEPSGFAGDFRPDGQQFVVGHRDGSLSLYDLATGGRLR